MHSSALLRTLPLLLAGERTLPPPCPRSGAPLLLSADDGDNELHSLLVQRAVQQCCYMARSVRDPPSAQWLAAFGDQPRGFETVHGYGCMALDWRDYLSALLAAPAEQLEVESKLKKNRGLSANNPYVKPTPITYTYEVVPSVIAERVMMMARQIAVEWAEEDLPSLVREGPAVWAQRRAAVTGEDEELRSTLPAFSVDQDANPDSPYRGGNYDLLTCLATRRAATLALRELESGKGGANAAQRTAEAGLLSAQMTALPQPAVELRTNTAATWLEGILELPLTMRVLSGGASLVDPSVVVDLLLEYRAATCQAWIEDLRRVPELQLEIKREHMRNQYWGI